MSGFQWFPHKTVVLLIINNYLYSQTTVTKNKQTSDANHQNSVQKYTPYWPSPSIMSFVDEVVVLRAHKDMLKWELGYRKKTTNDTVTVTVDDKEEEIDIKYIRPIVMFDIY